MKVKQSKASPEHTPQGRGGRGQTNPYLTYQQPDNGIPAALPGRNGRAGAEGIPETQSEECGRRGARARRRHDEASVRHWKEYFNRVLLTAPNDSIKAVMRQQFDSAYRKEYGF
jgi:hypothetical protein